MKQPEDINSPKVIHVSSATSWRGGEQQLAYLLSGLSHSGIKQQVLCVQDSPMAAYCEKNGIDFSTFRKTGSINLKVARLLKGICKTQHITIVHCHDSHAHTIAYLAALLFHNRTPIIVHRRVDFKVSPLLFSKVKYNHPSIAGFICVSNAIREILTPALRRPEKAFVIHSGIDTSRFAPVTDKGILRKEFGFDENSILIGNIAALAPHKDYSTFLRTAEILIQNNPGFRFVIIGEGSERKLIESEIIERNLANKVVLAGFRENIPELIKELNVLLLTSKTEGLGTSILDAFAGGLPVVATRTGGIPEIIEHKITGLLAEVGNAANLAEMTKLMVEDIALRERIIRNAAKKVSEFDFRITAAKTLDLYKKITPKESQSIQ